MSKRARIREFEVSTRGPISVVELQETEEEHEVLTTAPLEPLDAEERPVQPVVVKVAKAKPVAEVKTETEGETKRKSSRMTVARLHGIMQRQASVVEDLVEVQTNHEERLDDHERRLTLLEGGEKNDDQPEEPVRVEAGAVESSNAPSHEEDETLYEKGLSSLSDGGHFVWKATIVDADGKKIGTVLSHLINVALAVVGNDLNRVKMVSIYVRDGRFERYLTEAEAARLP